MLISIFLNFRYLWMDLYCLLRMVLLDDSNYRLHTLSEVGFNYLLVGESVKSLRKGSPDILVAYLHGCTNGSAMLTK
jgi:hypothetical protein